MAQNIMQHESETIETLAGTYPVAYAVETWDDGTYYVSWGIIGTDGLYEAIDVAESVCPTFDDAMTAVTRWAHAR